MLFTLKELATYLRVNQRTVMRMLKNNQIQGAKIGGQWRFNSSQVDQIFFPENKKEENGGEGPVSLQELTGQHAPGQPINRVLTPSRIIPELNTDDKDHVLQALLAPLFNEGVVLERQVLLDRLRDREKLLSTGVGDGVAIPHPRDPVTDLQTPSVIVMGRSKNGIDFDAIDGKPVHLFFLLCCERIETHLYLMGQLAQMIRNKNFIQRCIAADTTDKLFRIVLETEQKQEFSAPA